MKAITTKSAWPDIKLFWDAAYKVSPHYEDLFGPSVPPTLWQRISYALWRKHWYRFTDWLRDKVCGGCS